MNFTDFDYVIGEGEDSVRIKGNDLKSLEAKRGFIELQYRSNIGQKSCKVMTKDVSLIPKEVTATMPLTVLADAFKQALEKGCVYGTDKVKLQIDGNALQKVVNDKQPVKFDYCQNMPNIDFMSFVEEIRQEICIYGFEVEREEVTWLSTIRKREVIYRISLPYGELKVGEGEYLCLIGKSLTVCTESELEELKRALE